MHHIHHELNFVAIVVCAVIVWVIGAAWYSPLLFAKPWVAIVGRKMGEKPKGVYTGMIGSLIGDLLLCFVLAHIVIWSGAGSWMDGMHIGLLMWAGFFAATMFPQTIYEGRPMRYFLINAGYWLVSLVAVGAVLAIWH
jgi:Protein of unknown function (DUF1761)